MVQFLSIIFFSWISSIFVGGFKRSRFFCVPLYYIKCNESREIFGGNVMHNQDADRKACLNRQILNNSVNRKAMEDLCERSRELVHQELQSQDLDTYQDTRNISRNMHKARSSPLLLHPTDIEETHEPLSAVQVLTNSKEQFAC